MCITWGGWARWYKKIPLLCRLVLLSWMVCVFRCNSNIFFLPRFTVVNAVLVACWCREWWCVDECWSCEMLFVCCTFDVDYTPPDWLLLRQKKMLRLFPMKKRREVDLMYRFVLLLLLSKRSKIVREVRVYQRLADSHSRIRIFDVDILQKR